jgi:chromosome segregation ATPase
MSLDELTALQAAARPLRTKIAALERQIAEEEGMADADGDKLANWEYELEDLAPRLRQIEEDIFDLRTYMAEKRGCYCGSVSGFCNC